MTYKVGDICAVEIKDPVFAMWHLAKIMEIDADGETIMRVRVAYEDFDRDDWLYCAVIKDADLQKQAFDLAVFNGERTGYRTKESLKACISDCC